jgi:nitroimidazol reductase NimA-like FMN-containing flavoprotein (pyridoxamine 5'-phosphate oxidase superfamily)
MRRVENRLSEAEALEIVSQGEFATLSLVDSEGNHYGVPISYALTGNTIYIHGAREGHKISLLTHNREVCLTVVGANAIDEANFTTRYSSAIVYGTASLVEENLEKVAAMRLLVEKYSPAYAENAEVEIDKAVDKTAIIKIEIKTITGKGNRK